MFLWIRTKFDSRCARCILFDSGACIFKRHKFLSETFFSENTTPNLIKTTCRFKLCDSSMCSKSMDGEDALWTPKNADVATVCLVTTKATPSLGGNYVSSGSKIHESPPNLPHIYHSDPLMTPPNMLERTTLELEAPTPAGQKESQTRPL